MKIADILDKAADLIEPEGMWTQVHGPIKGTHPERCCAYIAINRVAAAAKCEVRMEVGGFFARHLLGRNNNLDWNVWGWNDAPGRAQPEVVAKLREAAAKAREQGL